MPAITLTTDFGTRDWFAGTMKGVLLRINPRAQIVELTHEIPPGDLRAGAFSLAMSYRFFPRGTVHVAVVDPGVGTSRRALSVQTTDYFFVGPDNGVLSWALAQARPKAIHAIENQALFLNPVSRTFHGRDIFAPGAAHLSRGVPIQRLGPALKDFVRLDWPGLKRRDEGVRGEVLYLDRFGNAITNIDEGAVKFLRPKPLRAALCRRALPVADCYGAVPPGHAVAVFGSSGFLELAINGGNAARRLRLAVGTVVTVKVAGRRGR